MSDVSGFISVSLALTDTTTLPTKTVLKTIGVNEDTEVTSGVVAILSGTVGTALQTLQLEPTTYRNASGEFVTFGPTTPPTRILLQSSGTNEVYITDVDLNVNTIYSKNNLVAATTWGGGASPVAGIFVCSPYGANDYTIVVLREE